MSNIKEEIESLVKKMENGDLSEQEELAVLEELNSIYDIVNKVLEEIKVEQLSANLKK